MLDFYFINKIENYVLLQTFPAAKLKYGLNIGEKMLLNYRTTVLPSMLNLLAFE